MSTLISLMPASSRMASPPCCTMLEAPLKAVVMMRLKSWCTGVPSAYLSALGTTVQPRRTPVKPAYLEKELTSMAHSSAPSISKMDLGSAG